MAIAELERPEATTEEPSARVPRSLRATVVDASRSTMVQACGLAVLLWPFTPYSLDPQSGLDPSWQYVLQQAASAGLPHGTRVAFSYGPLGFLFLPHVYRFVPAAASLLFIIGIQIGVMWLILRALRGRLSPWVALAVAYVVGAAVMWAGAVQQIADILHPELVFAFVLAACVAIIRRSEPAPRWWWVALGAAGAVFSLSLAGVAAGVVVLVVVAIACAPGDRLFATGGVALGGAVAGGISWFATGNSFGNIVPFAKSYIGIALGYAGAQEYFHQQSGYVFPAVCDTLVIAGLLWLVARRAGWRVRLGVSLMTALVLWLVAKESFVRPDGNHVQLYTAMAPLIVVALAVMVRSKRVVVGALLVTSALSFRAYGGVPTAPFTPDATVHNFASQVNDLLFSAKDRHRRHYITAILLGRGYEIPQAMLDSMQGHTVNVSPWEENVTWVYPKIKLDSLPGVQDYQAYTAYLDHLDANYLAGPHAPQQVLRQHIWPYFDGELATMTPPLTQLVMECRYREIMATPTWQLATRTPNRCGPARPLQHVRTTMGHMVTVPPAPTGSAVVATFSVNVPLSWKVEGFLMRPPTVRLRAIMQDGTKRTYRFLLGTEGTLHVVQAASTLGYSARFAPPDIRSFELLGPPGAHSDVTMSFYSMSMTS